MERANITGTNFRTAFVLLLVLAVTVDLVSIAARQAVAPQQ